MSIESNPSVETGRDAKISVYFADADAKCVPRSQLYRFVDHSEAGLRSRAEATVIPIADRTHELAHQLVTRADELLADSPQSTQAQGDTV